MGRRLIQTGSKTCLMCGEEFPRPKKRAIKDFTKQKYCSFACSARSRNPIQLITCPCGQEFKPERNGRKYCSRGCASRSNKPHASSTSRYRKIKTAKGWVHEHRHVMEQKLGRPLRRGESVHHKNGDKQDNKPNNLELWIRGHPTGGRLVDLFEFIAQNYLTEFQEYAWKRKV